MALLVKGKSMLSAGLGSGGGSFITTLFEVNEKNNTVTVDCSANEELNRQIERAGKISFRTDYHGIEVSFVGSALKKTTHKGVPAFSMPLPKTIFWRERREYYRVKTPVTSPNFCQINFEDREHAQLKIHDISLSGVGLLCDSSSVSEILTVGAVVENARLGLFGVGEGLISFEVRYQMITNPEKAHKIHKLGCKFLGLTNAVEDVIQRYMQKIQRDELQKEQGLS